MKYLIFQIYLLYIVTICNGQNGYGNNWLLGYDSSIPNINGSLLKFNHEPVQIFPIYKVMFLEASNVTMSNNMGELQFYSNGCYIAGSDHQIIMNGDSIGQGLLETSYCKTGGNPMTQGIIALPSPLNNHTYYLFYTDIQSPYEDSKEHFFPIAPLNLYYSIIDMGENEGKGKVLTKNQNIISDTLCRGMIQATRHRNDKDWWLIIPESHSNCYYTVKLIESGIDTIFRQCKGVIWGDKDLTGQVVFAPNSKKYVRFNYYYGLSIFNFDNLSGMLSEPLTISFGVDTFNYSGVAFSSNSRYLYATTFNKVYQFDTEVTDVESSKVLLGELNTPPNIEFKTRFNQAALAPDGKIYIAGTNTHNYLHIIQRPNCPGVNCNLEQYALEMPSFNLYGLPNIPSFGDWSKTDTCGENVNTIPVHESKHLKVFPNPVHNELHIEATTSFQLEMYDYFGRQVLVKQIDEDQITLSLNFLNEGVYFYKIIIKGELIKLGKIVKLD